MDMLTWAKNEIDIACKRERAKSDSEDDWDYDVACYESALKAFESLLEDGHSGFSIGITKNILNRLIDGRPLTAIEDVPEVWNEVSYLSRNGSREYQCKRMSSLFKSVYPDGTVEYRDNNRVICANIASPDVGFTCKLARDIIDAMDPITMPYYPVAGKYKVYMEDFLVDPANGDYDTQAVLYAVHPCGDKIEINRYFAEKNGKFVEIGAEEYAERKAKAL